MVSLYRRGFMRQVLLPLWVCGLMVMAGVAGFLPGCGSAPVDNPGTGQTVSLMSIVGKFLLTFTACDSTATGSLACTDPRNHKTYLAQSDDGAVWTVPTGYVPYSGSVPDAIRKGNVLYFYNPGKVHRYHIDTGVWDEGVDVQIQTSTGTNEAFVDPSVILDENGKIVLFYLVRQDATNQSGCPDGVSSCTKYFHSATEVDGGNGAVFTLDEGSRAEIVVTTGEHASDPDIFRGPSGFILLLSRGNSVQAMSCSTLKGTYANIAGLTDGMLITNLGGVPAGHYDSATGQFWIYSHITKNNIQVIRRAVRPSLDTPISESELTTILAGSNIEGLGSTYDIGSPGITLATAP
jgi:hypothetical protein